MEHITMQDFISTHHITMDAQPAKQSQLHLADAWLCTLSRVKLTETNYGAATLRYNDKRTLTVVHNSSVPPTAAQVLANLAATAATVEGKTFQHWAADLCRNIDSRAEENTYNMWRKLAERLKQFLRDGDHCYQTLLYKTQQDGGSLHA
jgi:ankyrin repeat protein